MNGLSPALLKNPLLDEYTGQELQGRWGRWQAAAEGQPIADCSPCLLRPAPWPTVTWRLAKDHRLTPVSNSSS